MGADELRERIAALQDELSAIDSRTPKQGELLGRLIADLALLSDPINDDPDAETERIFREFEQQAIEAGFIAANATT